MKDITQDIIEGNKLIAEFIEMIIHPATELSGNEILYQWPVNLKQNIGKDRNFPDINTYSLKRLQFHTSWDWLMPVLEKIPTLNPDKGRLWFEYQISRCHCRIYTNISEEWKNNGGTTHAAVYKTIVEFISWYNQNHQ